MAASGLAASASPPGPATMPSMSAASSDTHSPTDAANRVIKRRAPVACRSVFPSRGAPDLDREYRHPRMKGDKARKEGTRPVRSDSVGFHHIPPDPSLHDITNDADPWDLLPPLHLIVDAVNMFTHQYFQLGFIPRDTFAEIVRNDTRSVSPFLLFSILSVSGRLTDSLVTTFGDTETASELFMSRASAMALRELYEEPTLARCQAFYLLSLAQQGSGYKNKSYVRQLNLGIAIRMALLMQLHREETYVLEDSTPSMIQEAESARRTLWMLYSQDNLHSAPSAPVSLAASDITTLLPCNERDFADGILPKRRAALEDTQPAIENPSLVRVPERSLFGTLIQSHRLWGIVSRRAVRNARCMDPWADTSDYAQIQKQLSQWEDQLPPDHLWSPAQFKKSKSESYDLAYLIVTMVTRLCNIIIRRTYLPSMLQQGGNSLTEGFWGDMSLELFANVKDLFTQIDVWFLERRPGDSTGAQMAIFCVYSCGLMAAYLCKYPHVCRKYAPEGKHMFDRTRDILAQSKTVWPLAKRWLGSLERFFTVDQKNISNIASGHLEGSMAEGKDPIPSALHPPLTNSRPSGPPKTPLDDRQYVAKQLRPDSPHVRSASPGNISNSASAAQRLPPQLRTNDSLLNGRMRLPPPNPSPVLVTTTITSAPHYSTAQHPHSQPAQFLPQQLQYQLHQPPPQALSLSTSQSMVPMPLPQMHTQPLPQSVPHSPMHHIPDDPVTANASTGVPTITTTPTNMTTALSPSMTSAVTHSNIDLLVRAFDPPSSSQISVPHAGVSYSHLPQQVLLSDGTTATAPFYEPSYAVPVNDGFENELAFMMVGSETSATTPWAPSFFRY
ncbi:transcription factor [Grosmannia clavigera kw1407]|uniref:Transcription factor n=1 Tax=Grosmannia clavigera (strain kw1407 / UAMH 11150) TaxID=655863 RepID=F0XJZ5_GROCL|nr:transcription factor [Grosmannia clavigera kw1407]EFX01951.1 transcription factor [Grosmannia clavigera kw1407]